MAKSVTSLLLGICLDRGLIASLDDTADAYVPELRGTLHGGSTLRQLSNMSSGVAGVHASINSVCYPSAFESDDANIAKFVASMNERQEPEGARFNYNEICPLTIGMVIRSVTGQTMSAFAEEAVWQPMGAEADATWQTDSTGAEFNCIGFVSGAAPFASPLRDLTETAAAQGCRLRDWGRLGLLVAQGGVTAEGRRIVSEDWISEVTSWRADEQQALFAKGKHTNSTALLEDYDVVHGPNGHEEGALGVAYKSCEPLGKPLSL